MMINHKNKNWVIYLTRPFTLLGASIWHKWYSSKQTLEILGVDMKSALFIEEHENVFRQYRTKEQLERFHGLGKELVNNLAKSINLLKTGLKLNNETENFLKIGPESFKNLESAVDFIIHQGLHSTTFPFWATQYAKELNIKNKELEELSDKLRAVSYYPQFINEIITPLAIKELEKQGIKNAKQAVNVLTLSEIINKKTDKIEERLKAKKDNKKFIYQVLDGKETIDFIKDPNTLIKEIENLIITDELKGQTAFPGIVRGKARIVLTNDIRDVKFDKKDILVTISSNPSLLPLMKKAAAIVTDEGGITSHAAVVARELKKPCIIGTKIATKVLKDNMLIEVDANKGMIKIL